MSLFNLVREYIPFEGEANCRRIEFNCSGKAPCLFHEEKTPSFHNFGTHGYCFGCGKIADIIDLEVHFTGLPPFEAALSLAKRYGIQLPEFTPKDKEKADKQTTAYKLLERLAKWANRNIKKHPEVLEFPKKKGLDEADIDCWFIGYVGDENPVANNLKDKFEIELAKKIGLINEHGNDHFRNRIIFPVWNYGKVVFLTGRAFPNGEPKYLHLKNSELVYRQIAFAENLKKDVCVIVEGITDAMAFIKVGKPACALLGTNIGDKGREAVLRAKRKLYFCLDRDEPGKEASYRLAKEYKSYTLDLEYVKDPDEVLAEIGPEEFKRVVEKVIEEAPYYLDLVIDREDAINFLAEIATIEYASEQEKWLKKLKDKTGITLEALKKDLERIKDSKLEEGLRKAAEKTEKDTQPADPLSEYTEVEIQKARGILNSPDILDRVIKITEDAGYVGEEINKKMLYLSFTSRLMDDSISNVVKGVSSSGKSSLVQSVLSLIPKNDISSYSFVTAKSLVHSKLDLSHKILFVQERHGSEQADYSIRTTLSEKELSILIPIKDEATGNFTSIEKKVSAEGMVYIETTTQERIHNENETRVFNLFIDESSEQTARVIDAEAEDIKDKEKLESERRVWRCAQILLKPYDVQIPFAKELANIFPKDKVRARRDFKRFLTLIRTHTLLFQFQRDTNEKGQPVTTLDDLKAILPLAEVVLAQSLKDLSPKQEKVLETIQTEFMQGQEFQLKDLHKITSGIVSNRTLQRWVKDFVKDGLLDWNGEKGKKSMYSFSTLSVSMSSCRNTTNFISNLLKLLDNNSRQNGLSSINPNNDSELGDEIPIDAMTTQKLEKKKKDISRTTSRDGETIYHVTEYKNGSKAVYLVYPGDSEYSHIAKAYDDDIPFKGGV